MARWRVVKDLEECDHEGTGKYECFHGSCQLDYVQGGYRGDIWFAALSGWLVNRYGHGRLYKLADIYKHTERSPALGPLPCPECGYLMAPGAYDRTVQQ
jgi:hypothetical protein